MKLVEIISGGLVLLSYPLYITRIWQGRKLPKPLITPNLMSWTIWTLIAWSLLLSYNSAEREGAAFYAAIAGTIGCTLTFISALFNKHEKSLNWRDITCGLIGLSSLILWYFTKNNVRFVQFALYLAIFADIMGIVPTARFLTKHPDKDRPLLYIVFSFGYGLSLFAIENYTFISCSLPVAMFIAPSFVWVPSIKYRIKNKISIKEWY